MKKILLYTLFLLPQLLMAQNAEKSGLTFLKIGYGARNIAMGDLGFVIADPATANFYNPALLKKNNYQASFTHSSYMQDVTSEMFGAAFTLFDLPFALGINTTSISDIEIRTLPGEPDGTFNANYFYGSLSSAFEVSENISLGITGKYLYENLYSDEATGWGADFGIVYGNLIDNLTLALSINNIGSMNQLRNEETNLPSSLSIGGSYLFTVKNSSLDILLASGYKRYFSAESNHFHSGLEIKYAGKVSGRIGYLTGFEARDLSYGLGVALGSFEFDYAFVPNDFALGNSSYLTIIYTF